LNCCTILLHSEDEKELDKVKKYLALLDIPDQNLLVKAHIYEVNYSNKDGSAIGLLMNLASNKLNIQFNSTSTLDNVLKFTSNGLSLVFSNIETDSRFKLLSSPYLRIKSGSSSVWWGLDLMGFDIGFPMVLGAYTTKFIIKLMRGMG